jgi:hypothetical protein
VSVPSQPNPVLRSITTPFTLKELLGGRDFRRALGLTALTYVIWIAAGSLESASASDLFSVAASFSGFVVSNTIVVSAAMLGLVLAAVAVMVSFSDPRYLARMYAYDPRELDKYLEVLFFPAKLAVATVVIVVFFRVVSGLPGTPNWVFVAGVAPVLLFLFWELMALLEAIRQIRGLIVTGARKYDLKGA